LTGTDDRCHICRWDAGLKLPAVSLRPGRPNFGGRTGPMNHPAAGSCAGLVTSRYTPSISPTTTAGRLPNICDKGYEWPRERRDPMRALLRGTSASTGTSWSSDQGRLRTCGRGPTGVGLIASNCSPASTSRSRVGGGVRGTSSTATLDPDTTLGSRRNKKGNDGPLETAAVLARHCYAGIFPSRQNGPVKPLAISVHSAALADPQPSYSMTDPRDRGWAGLLDRT